MRQALDHAGLAPADVSVVMAAANSSQLLDHVEAQALEAVFGPRGVPVSAIKGALGESGASAAGSIASAILCLNRRVVPPTVGFEVADPDCPVDVSSTARPLTTTGDRPAALINGFASGGTNFSLVVTT